MTQLLTNRLYHGQHQRVYQIWVWEMQESQAVSQTTTEEGSFHQVEEDRVQLGFKELLSGRQGGSYIKFLMKVKSSDVLVYWKWMRVFGSAHI